MAAIPAQVRLNPDVTELPGGDVLMKLVNGIGGFALIIALAALVVSAAIWAIAAHGQNYNYTVAGKRGVIVAGLAALLIGAADSIINFFYNAGTGVS